LLHSIAHSLSSVRNEAVKSSLREGFFSRRSNLLCYYTFSYLSSCKKDCFTPSHIPFLQFAMTLQKSSLREGFFSRRSNLLCYYTFSYLSSCWKDCFTPSHIPFLQFAMTL